MGVISHRLGMIQPVATLKFAGTDMVAGARKTHRRVHSKQARQQGKRLVAEVVREAEAEPLLARREAEERAALARARDVGRAGDLIDAAIAAFHGKMAEARAFVRTLPADTQREAGERLWFPVLD